jgi:hypothetical protein
VATKHQTDASQIGAGQTLSLMPTVLSASQPSNPFELSQTASKVTTVAPTIQSAPLASNLAQATTGSSSLLDMMKIDYSAPKVHTSLFSQPAIDSPADDTTKEAA